MPLIFPEIRWELVPQWHEIFRLHSADSVPKRGKPSKSRVPTLAICPETGFGPDGTENP
jgi:hypothetical protein